MEKQYHLGFGETLGAKYVLLPGDPGRVESIAIHLDNPLFYCQNREYTTWIGELCGEPVMVMSTGMGGPSTAIAVEELHKLGIHTFIRMGTCGGIAHQVKGGDIVIATGAIRQDGTSKEYVPIEFPAVANIDVTNSLIQAAKNLNAEYHAGIVQCKDSFYGQHSPDRMPIGYELKDKWEAWKKSGTLASEMESATLYIVSQILGARAGCALYVIWNQERAAAGLPDIASHDPTLGIQVVVESVRLLIKADKQL
ncbi:MAG: uridine phosphorylase [Oscillospiraceae bacterium]|jgi:uridine phosphorylase|nr:uridine phosphorylase [Oscillospiraceae bacterium]